MNLWAHSGGMVFLQHHAMLRGRSCVAESVELQVDVVEEDGEQGAGLRLWEGTGFGDGLG